MPRATRAGAIAALLAALLLGACNSRSSTAPSPVAVEPGPTHYSLMGLVAFFPAGAAEVLATVEVVAGVNAGATVAATADGRYVFNELLPGEMTVVASAAGYNATTISVTLTANQTMDFGLQASPPPVVPPPVVPPVPPPPVRVTLSGVVTDASAVGLASARVEVVSGPNAGRFGVADLTGRYQIESLLLGAASVEAAAAGFVSQTLSRNLVGDDSADFRLLRVAVETNGRAVDALTRTGLGGVVFVGAGVSGVPSDASGAFLMTATGSAPALRWLTFTGPNVVARQTGVRVPGPDAIVSLIATDFDLAAFDQMFRTPVLTRWTTAPPLVIERSVLQFTDVNMSDGTALDDVMSPTETDSLLSDLTGALPLMTGGTFAGFSSVRIETGAVGAVVNLLNEGVITVSWVAGLQAATGYWGYGRWSAKGDGSVTGGLLMLDSDFQRSGSPFVRSLRVHELGHGLGYRHVTGTPSVMNVSARLEPTAFDHDATRIAFERQPGNRSPDIDPGAATINPLNRIGGRWSAPMR